MPPKRFIVVEQSALAVGGHYAQYTTAIARAAQSAGSEAIVLCNRRASPDTFPEDIETRPTFSMTWGEAEHGTGDGRPMRFGHEVQAALSALQAGPDDVVLVHTLGYQELHSLLDLLCRLPPESMHPTVHVLLRYDPEPLARMSEAYLPYFKRIQRSPTLSRSVVFHADTERLALAFRQVTGTEFLHAPIPFDQTHLREALGGAAARMEERLTILYLGDARLEKGYARLPAAIASLWTDLVEPGRVRFVIQSNFNTPGGEPGILTAQQQLGAYADQRVRLIPDALDAPEYYRHLAEADIALIPYEADRYRARSSGVLVEAMAAGLPIVTSAGSWMETQVGSDNAVLFDDPDDLADVLRRAVADYPALRAGALARQAACLDRATPDAFIRHIAAATPQRVAVERPRVLFVMNGDAIVLRNGSSRIARSQLSYLAAADYAVVGVFLSHERLHGDDRTARRAALMAALHDFAFERVFVATPGHPWSDLSLGESGTLREEFANAAAYEVSAALSGFLRTNPPDLVLLNYVTALPLVEALGIAAPVICEMHDLQAIQRAIYGTRQVRADDVALEMAHLARCRHIISLSPRETTFVRDNLRDTPVTTIGVQIDPSPVKLADLAGLRDLADVVAACGPRPSARIPARNDAALRDASEIDVLFVSSAHVSNVSGLRWFLDAVRARFLPDIRVVVAGGICDLGPWPDEPRLSFLGQVDDLTPLYAAARVVILPIREGAGSAVKTYEALAFGKPIVATSLALRGLAGTEGIPAYDDPEDFATAVEALLTSRDLRVAAAAAARALAARLGDPAHYRATLDGIIAGVLGDRPGGRPALPATGTEGEGEGEGEFIEWEPVLGVVNRLCHAIIVGAVPDALLRTDIAGHGVEATLDLVERVARTILAKQPVTLLGSDRNAAAMRLGAGPSVQTIVETARVLIGAEAQGGGHHLLIDGRTSLRVSMSGGAATSAHVRADRTPLRASARDAATWNYRPQPDAHPHLGLVLDATDAATWSVVQALDRAAFGAILASLRHPGGGAAIRLTLPACISGTSWIEVDLPVGAPSLAIRIGDVLLPAVWHASGGTKRLRAAVPRDLAPPPFAPLAVAFQGLLDPATIRDLRVGWSSQSLEALLDTQTEGPNERLADIVPEAAPSVLNDLFSGVLRRSARARTTRPLCVSPTLSLTIAVDRMPAGTRTLRCFADGAELPRTESDEAGMSFFRAGAVSDSWQPRIRFLGPGRNPISGTVTIALDGLADPVTGQEGFTATNLHDPEYVDGRISHRWSGAAAVTLLELPTWSSAAAHLEIALAALGRNTEAADVAVAIDGEGTAIERAERDGMVVLTVPISPRMNAGSTRIEIAVRKTFQPEGDPRKLGVAVRSMRLVYPFTANADPAAR